MVSGKLQDITLNNMKNISLFLILSMIIISCVGEISKKGNWSSSDMDKCKKEGMDGLRSEKMIKYLSSKETTAEEITDCNCKNLEQALESYSIFTKLTPDELREDYNVDWKDCLNSK